MDEMGCIFVGGTAVARLLDRWSSVLGAGWLTDTHRLLVLFDYLLLANDTQML